MRHSGHTDLHGTSTGFPVQRPPRSFLSGRILNGDREPLAERGERLLNPRQLRRMPRIEDSANFLLIAAEPPRDCHVGQSRFSAGQIEGSFSGYEGRYRHQNLPAAARGSLRDVQSVSDAAGDRFLQAIGSLHEGIGPVLSGRDGLGQVPEPNSKPAGFFRRERDRISELSHYPRSSFVRPSCVKHGVERTRRQFLLQVLHYGAAGLAVVQGAVAAFAALALEPDRNLSFLSKTLDPANEFARLPP